MSSPGFKCKADAKSWCPKGTCGPHIETGMTTTFWVCTQCKKEVTEKLAEVENSRFALSSLPSPPAHVSPEEIDYAELMRLQGNPYIDY